MSPQIVFYFYLCPYACLSVCPSVRSFVYQLVSEKEVIILRVCPSVRPPVRLSVSEVTNFRYINAHNIKMINTVICAYNFFPGNDLFYFYFQVYRWQIIELRRRERGNSIFFAEPAASASRPLVYVLLLFLTGETGRRRERFSACHGHCRRCDVGKG